MSNNEERHVRGTGKPKSKRGSTDNEGRLGRLFRPDATGHADWGNASPEALSSLVCAITALGGACSFGLSRDRGAYSVTLMLGGERETLWWNGGADLDAEIEQALYLIQTLA